jgi:hypothetical protein
MEGRFGAETWSAERGAMIFHCRDEIGVKWTFCVNRSTLEALEPDQTIIPDLTFNQFRAQIYAAATTRMKSGSPEAQQVIPLHEIRG